MAKILLAEDDHDLSEVLTFALKNNGHMIQQVFDGQECLVHLQTCKFDLLILDWMMPRVSGLEVCREYRSKGGKMPILMLTAKIKIEDRESALDSGADDYLTKPFDQRELAARVRALLRRPDAVVGNVLKSHDISLDTVTLTVTRGTDVIHLRPKELSLLEFLMRHPNQAFSTDALLQRVWLDDVAATSDNLKTHIKMLRQKLDAGRPVSIIRTIRGRGYLLHDH
ncbi:MAG: response regulator transcription factor [Candidatus Obscuribacterales bacterium]|nr:response regulator transcription factor [Candidatus Obscuribacterales bacterium]